MLEEQLEIVRGLWSISGDETFDFSGEHYQLEGAPARQRPVQDSVPIIVGGGGPTRTPRIAARYASEFNSFSGPTGAGDRFDVVHNHSLHHLPVAMADLLPVPLVTTLHTPPLPWLESAVAVSGGASSFTAVSECTARAWAGTIEARPVLNGVDTRAWRPGPWALGRGA